MVFQDEVAFKPVTSVKKSALTYVVGLHPIPGGHEWNKIPSSLPLSLLVHEHNSFWILRLETPGLT